MLVNSKYILDKAYKGNYAIGAYNINNLEWTKYILEACNSDNAPIILAASENAIKYMGGYKVVYNMVTSLIKELNIKIPVCLHLDHGKSIESCIKAIDSGFTSVMIDASDKSMDENIKITSEVVSYAQEKNVSVEAEIGTLDGIGLSDPLECVDFISSTNIDVLAPSIGNKHGIYGRNDKLNFMLLGEISKKSKIPLALHGSSGLDDNKIKTAVFCGVSKININTDFQLEWTKEVRKFLRKNKKEYDPRKIISSGEKAIKKVVHDKNNLFGSINKAFI